MIVLDTNALNSFALNGVQMAILKKLAASKNQNLRIPQIVYDEYIARKRREIESAQTRLVQAYDELQRLAPWPGARPVINRDAADIAETYHGGGVRQIFQIIEAAPEIAVEAIRREVWREAPAKTSGESRGAGARDALVWLTTLDFARRFDREVFFISADKAAFGGLSGLLPELAAEADTAEVSITLLSKVDELFSLLAPGRPDPDDFSFNPKDFTSTVKEHIYNSLIIIDVASQLGLLGTEHGIITWHWDEKPTILDALVRETHSYRVDSLDFLIVKTQWDLLGTLKYGFQHDTEPGTNIMTTPYALKLEVSVDLTFAVERESPSEEWRTEIVGQGVAKMRTAKRR